MTSSKPATQTTVQQENHDPWAPSTPYLGELLTEGQRLYTDGSAATPYSGQTYAGLGDLTQQGIAGIAANTGPSAATNNGIDWTSSTLANGGHSQEQLNDLASLGTIRSTDLNPLISAVNGLNDPNSTQMQVANGLANGTYDANTEADYRNLLGQVSDPSVKASYQSLLDQNAGPSSTETNLADVAAGKYLDPANGNPYLDSLINQGATDAANQVAAKYAASGRYGSGSFSKAVADATGQIATSTRANEYDQERTRQADANSAIDAAKNARLGLSSNITGAMSSDDLSRLGLSSNLIGAITGVQQANTANKLSGAQLAAQQAQAAVSGQQGIVADDRANLDASQARATTALQSDQNATQLAAGLLPQLSTLEQLRTQPYQQLLQAGALQDADRQAQDTDAQTRYDNQQDAQWRNLGLLQQIAQPIAGLGGSSSGVSYSQSTPAQASPFQQVFGGGVGLIGALGKAGLF